MSTNAESTMGDYIVRVPITIPKTSVGPHSLRTILNTTDLYFNKRPLQIDNIIGIVIQDQSADFVAGTINAAGDDWEPETTQLTHTDIDLVPYSEPFMPSAALDIEAFEAATDADVTAVMVCIMGKRDCALINHSEVEVPT